MNRLFLLVLMGVVMGTGICRADDYYVCVKEPCFEGTVGIKPNGNYQWSNIKYENWVYVHQLKLVSASWVSAETASFNPNVVYESVGPYDGSYQPKLVPVNKDKK